MPAIVTISEKTIINYLLVATCTVFTIQVHCHGHVYRVMMKLLLMKIVYSFVLLILLYRTFVLKLCWVHFWALEHYHLIPNPIPYLKCKAQLVWTWYLPFLTWWAIVLVVICFKLWQLFSWVTCDALVFPTIVLTYS